MKSQDISFNFRLVLGKIQGLLWIFFEKTSPGHRSQAMIDWQLHQAKPEEFGHLNYYFKTHVCLSASPCVNIWIIYNLMYLGFLGLFKTVSSFLEYSSYGETVNLWITPFVIYCPFLWNDTTQSSGNFGCPNCFSFINFKCHEISLFYCFEYSFVSKS